MARGSNKYMREQAKKVAQRMPQREKDRATIASYPRGTGRVYEAGNPSDEFSRAVERSYEADQRRPSGSSDYGPRAAARRTRSSARK